MLCLLKNTKEGEGVGGGFGRDKGEKSFNQSKGFALEETV